MQFPDFEKFNLNIVTPTETSHYTVINKAMDNTKTAEEILQEKLDLIGKGNTTQIQFCYKAIFDSMEEYASPLKKRIEELEAMVNLKLDRPEHDKIVLTNKIGDTFTSRSEELIDFLHGYPSTNGKQD